MSIESVMPSSHFILCRPLLLLPPIPPSIRAFPMSQLFAWGGQSTGVSALASFLPKKCQGGSPSECVSIEIQNRLMVACGYGQSVDGRETDTATEATWGILVMMEMLPIVTACRYLTCDIVRCQVWGKLGKGYMESLCIISYNRIWTYNYFKS